MNSTYRSPAPARYAAGLRQGELPLVQFHSLGRLRLPGELRGRLPARPSMVNQPCTR